MYYKKILNIIFFLTVILNLQAQDFDLPLNYYKAEYYLSQNLHDSALLLINNCSDNYCIELKIDILISQSKYSEAINLSKQLNKTNPATANYKLAKIYAFLSFADESVEYLKKYFEFKDPLPYSKIIKENCFEQISKTSEWRNFWQNARYNNYYEKLFESEYLINTGKYDDAKNMLSENFGSYQYLKYYQLALIDYYKNDYSSSYKQINQTLSIKKNYIPALILKYKLEFQLNDFQNALRTKEQLLKIDKYNSIHLYDYAEINYKTKEYSKALNYINIFIDCFPQNENALFLKAEILATKEDFKNALIVLNELLNLNTSKTDYFNLRGNIYYSIKTWEFALKDFTMSLDIDPYDAEIWKKTGDCYFNMNFKEKACYAWKRAATLKSTDAGRMFYKECEGK
jgi:tetratricopeptide (TPR) repeat protein